MFVNLTTKKSFAEVKDELNFAPQECNL